MTHYTRLGVNSKKKCLKCTLREELIGEKTTLEFLQEGEECHRPVWKVQTHSRNTITNTTAAAESWKRRQLGDIGETRLQQCMVV